MKAIINMTTAFLLLLMFLFGWSLVTYNEEPLKYQWLDANGEFKTSSYDVTVSYNLDTPLDDLNGNSLNDVFLDGNELSDPYFNNGTSDWVSSSEAGHVSVLTHTNDDNMLVTLNSSYHVAKFRTDFIATSQHYFYYNFDIYGDVNINYMTYFTGSSYSVLSYLDEGWQNVSKLYQNSRSTSGISHYFQFVNTYGTQVSGKLDNVFILDLTDLNMTNVSKDTLDYWYSEYQRLQDNQIENYKELGSTVESSWQFLTGYFTTLVDILDAQVQVILNPFEALAEGLSIITVPIFG